VSVETDQQGKPNVEFTADGALKAAELKIMNLRPGISKTLVWEEVSTHIMRNAHFNFLSAALNACAFAGNSVCEHCTAPISRARLIN
jgi:hypothetical protein